VALALNRDPLHWWRKFAENVMMGGDVYTNLAKELSSSYMWQSAVSSCWGILCIFMELMFLVFFLQGRYMRTRPLVLQSPPWPLSGSNLSSKAIRHTLCAFPFSRAPYPNPSLVRCTRLVMHFCLLPIKTRKSGTGDIHKYGLLLCRTRGSTF
jgi:hypothetical protein